MAQDVPFSAALEVLARMPDNSRRGLSDEELAEQRAADLPDREAMSLLDGLPSLADMSLLNLDVNLDAAIDAAAPINAAVAANANVAAPIDAAVSANIASVGSTSVANAPQTSVISQTLDGVAHASADQNSDIAQGESGAEPSNG
jgi:hypothetical protein